MLPNTETCLPGPDVCCDTLFSLGEAILALAADAVNNVDCNASVCSAPNVEGIVTIGRAASYPHTDLITVSMTRLSPRQTAQAPGRTPGAITFLSTWQIDLIESGWVTFDEEGELPDPGFVSLLALHSYSHAEQMFRRLANAVMKNTLGSCAGSDCGASIGDLVPIDPLGHTVGWGMSLTIPVDLSKVCGLAD